MICTFVIKTSKQRQYINHPVTKIGQQAKFSNNTVPNKTKTCNEEFKINNVMPKIT